MIGLAVGIDYALFIFTKHRQFLGEGIQKNESNARPTGTAGSAVVFAGLTVIVALCGLTVVNIPFMSAMGLTAGLSVLMAVLASVFRRNTKGSAIPSDTRPVRILKIRKSFSGSSSPKASAFT